MKFDSPTRAIMVFYSPAEADFNQEQDTRKVDKVTEFSYDEGTLKIAYQNGETKVYDENVPAIMPLRSAPDILQ
jgi:hypothetical protein